MAEKGFGVKEVNLIGASGTPTITSPNNLNLNAVNVAISTNVSIGGTLSVTGNVSVGGTLTYEDVTNIDSVGLITARNGLNVTAGVGTFGGGINVSSGTLDIATQIRKSSGTLDYLSATHTFSNVAGSTEYFRFASSGQLGIAGANYGTSGQVLTSAGSGSAVSWSDVSITPTATDVQVSYELLSTSASGAGWRITGNGIVNTVNNPDLYLIRGQKYRFINNSGGSHPFRIQSDSSTAYGTGVTNNNASSGNIDFVPQNDAPARLYYNCTNHGGMLGNIYLRGAGGHETNVGVTTFSQTTSSVAGVTVTSQGLHHYEEGTFTPFIGALSSMPSVTYGSERGGKYTRIGNIVFYSLGFQMTAYSGGSGNVYIGGFPYVGSGNPGWDGAHVFRDCSAIGLNSRTNQLGGWMETSTAAGYPYMHLQQHSSTSSFAAGTIAASSISTGRITVHGHYKVG